MSTYIIILVLQTASSSFATYPANNPNEDRYVEGSLPTVFGAVFDGHGGYEVSDYLSVHLSDKLSELYPSEVSEESIEAMLFTLFDELESDLVLNASCKGEDYSRIGACATIALVFDTWLAVGNAGDCQAALISTSGENICEVHSANNPAEQDKLKAKFPDDKNIYVCKSRNACYVKGALMPTRSFGDFRLKDEYITHVPDVKIKHISEKDRFLVLATDGLWDHFTPEQVSSIIHDVTESQLAADLLVEKAIEKAALNRGMTVSDIKNIMPGRRRYYHDDITVVVLPLNRKIQEL